VVSHFFCIGQVSNIYQSLFDTVSVKIVNFKKKLQWRDDYSSCDMKGGFKTTSTAETNSRACPTFRCEGLGRHGEDSPAWKKLTWKETGEKHLSVII